MTEQEFEERVARAVCDQYPGKCCKEYTGMARCDEPKPGARRIARAAIKVIRQIQDAGKAPRRGGY